MRKCKVLFFSVVSFCFHFIKLLKFQLNYIWMRTHVLWTLFKRIAHWQRWKNEHACIALACKFSYSRNQCQVFAFFLFIYLPIYFPRTDFKHSNEQSYFLLKSTLAKTINKIKLEVNSTWKSTEIIRTCMRLNWILFFFMIWWYIYGANHHVLNMNEAKWDFVVSKMNILIRKWSIAHKFQWIYWIDPFLNDKNFLQN